jgi:predicted PurR-regulated permease PerM
MIPFAVPFIFAIVCLLLFSQGDLVAAIVIAIWGTTVMFIVDHFVRPYVIGGSIRLPFLAVLFGILGGVKTMGIVGLFIGPVIMTLFITLWRESELLSDSTLSVSEER